MATHSEKLGWWGARICGTGRIDVTFMGRSPVRIQPEMVKAVEALEHALISNGYELPIGVTGSYACRKISGTNIWSLHAVPIAIDVDYANNRVQPYGVERGFGTSEDFLITEAQVDAVEAIVNSDGASIWKWLGWRPYKADPMHFEIDVPPEGCQPMDDGTAPNLDECEPWQVDAWQAAYDHNPDLITEHTHPTDLLTKGDYFVFQDRDGNYQGDTT